MSLWSELHEQPATVAGILSANRASAVRFARRIEAEPITHVEPGFPVLAVAPVGSALAGVQELLAGLRKRRADLVVLSDDSETVALYGKSVPLPTGLPEWLTPVPAIVAGQLFAYHLAVVKGLDPDHPRGLSKITRTR